MLDQYSNYNKKNILPPIFEVFINKCGLNLKICYREVRVSLTLCFNLIYVVYRPQTLILQPHHLELML